MKIAFISDCHFGHNWGTELENDSFNQAKDAFEKTLQRNVDLIVLAGDIFDSRVPKQEVFAKALDCFSSIRGIPIIAIHGTHERRSAGLINPVHLLERIGLLKHLHKDKIIFEKNSEKVAIFGMSGVPEQYATQVLKEWDPKPEPGIKNIFVFHQSIKEAGLGEEGTLSYEDLPKGFDLYVDGHIHSFKKIGKLVITGSTLITQLKKEESKKGFVIWDSNTDELEFVEIRQRPFFYIEIELKGEKPEEFIERSREELSKLDFNEKPLVKIKLKGELKAGRINEEEIKKGFNAFIFVDNEVESKDFTTKLDYLREKQKGKSVDEIGLSLLKKILEKEKYEGPEVSSIIDSLADGNIDEIFNKIVES
ncbi:MAG: metallophosphoesterase [archaeon]